MTKAKAYATALREDPVMAWQIREYIPPEQLIELLGITENDIMNIFRGAVVGDAEVEE